MVMNNTSTLEISIHEVSPEFSTTSSAMARPGVARDSRAPSPANLRRVIELLLGRRGVRGYGLNCVGAGFAGTDADSLFQVDHEDLAVTDLAGVGRLGDGFNHAIQLVISNGHVDFHLRQKVDHVFSATVQLGVALLPTEAFHFSDGDALHADLRQGFAHVVQLERLDDGSD